VIRETSQSDDTPLLTVLSLLTGGEGDPVEMMYSQDVTIKIREANIRGTGFTLPLESAIVISISLIHVRSRPGVYGFAIVYSSMGWLG
jgi:hypothetical protein